VLLARYGAMLVIGLRFVYGLRLAGVLAIGMSRMPWVRFAGLNLFGALLWALIIGGVGYLLGDAVEALSKDLRFAAYLVVAAAIVCAAIVWVFGRRARRHMTKRQ
jgi:membrane protein DedA with SNARE-associated domain